MGCCQAGVVATRLLLAAVSFDSGCGLRCLLGERGPGDLRPSATQRQLSHFQFAHRRLAVSHASLTASAVSTRWSDQQRAVLVAVRKKRGDRLCDDPSFGPFCFSC